jgi:hypothetical protein
MLVVPSGGRDVSICREVQSVKIALLSSIDAVNLLGV